MSDLFFAYNKTSSWKERCSLCKRIFPREELERIGKGHRLNFEKGRYEAVTVYLCEECDKKLNSKVLSDRLS